MGKHERERVQARPGTNTGRYEQEQVRAGAGTSRSGYEREQAGGQAGTRAEARYERARAMGGGEWRRVQTQARVGGRPCPPHHNIRYFFKMYIIFFKTLPTTSKEGNLQVPMVLRVFVVSRQIPRYGTGIPGCGYTGFGGTGMVWEKPTRGIPVLNPRHAWKDEQQHTGFGPNPRLWFIQQQKTTKTAS